MASIPPELVAFLDPADDVTATFEEFEHEGERRIRLTQTSEFESDVVDLRWIDDRLEMVPPTDLIVEKGVPFSGPATPAEHATMYEHQKSQVNVFSSATGPDGGNLACVWAVRHLAKAALGRWITRVDLTTTFEQELRAALGAPGPETQVVAGGLVISPTQYVGSTRQIGHVGYLGTGSGPGRLIYSNSSGRARWEQNFTLASWENRYRNRKGLPVYFYALPG